MAQEVEHGTGRWVSGGAGGLVRGVLWCVCGPVKTVCP